MNYCRLSLAQTLVFLVAASAVAQQPTPSVQDVLSRARDDIAASYAAMPDVFCEEKINSSKLYNGKVQRETTFDSILSTKKTSGADRAITESRDVRLVDGKPPKQGKKYVLPITVNGGFGVLFGSSLSSAYDQCNTYKLAETGTSEGNLLGLEVSRKVNSKQIAGCEGLSERAVYTFWLDRITYQIQRIEVVDRIPNGQRGFKSIAGRNDFLTVQFGPKSYLLPAGVRLTVTMEPGSSEQFVFEARYANCHKFGADSSIVSGSVEEPH